MVKKFHYGFYAIIVKNSHLLLITKTRGPYKGLLDMPGGRAEHGEHPVDTVVREVAEETGYCINNVQLVDVMTCHVVYDDVGQSVSLHHGAIFYTATVDRYENFCIKNDEDAACAQWYAYAHLEQHQVSPLVWHVITHLL